MEVRVCSSPRRDYQKALAETGSQSVGKVKEKSRQKPYDRCASNDGDEVRSFVKLYFLFESD